MFQTPILLLVFNRLDTTRQVFEQIRKIQPRYLYIAADGPRKGIKEDVEKCTSVKQFLKNAIDWPCEVKTLFREENLGCGLSPSEAITWFFDNVEQGIILEDDCIPSQAFFSFCEQMLDRYKTNELVHQINGTNFQFGKVVGSGSYYFSNYNICWGWASWARAWKDYRYHMNAYAPREQLVASLKRLNTRQEQAYFTQLIDLMYDTDRNDIWDYQWYMCMLFNNRLAICPNKNLVSNVGFGLNSTHTTQTYLKINRVELGDLESHKIRYVDKIEANSSADFITYRNYFDSPESKINKVRRVFYCIFPEDLFLFYRRVKSFFNKSAEDGK